MEMIEKVAIALYDRVSVEGVSIEWNKQARAIKNDYREQAMIAIEAMREPTEEMVEAGGIANYGHSRQQATEWAKTEKWDAAANESVFLYTAMITAALQEGKETGN